MHNGCLGRGNVTLMSLNMKLQPRDDDTETLESFAQKKRKEKYHQNQYMLQYIQLYYLLTPF